MEGSTVTETENRLLFDDGISTNGRSMGEQLMNQKMIQKNRREPLLIPGDFLP